MRSISGIAIITGLCLWTTAGAADVHAADAQTTSDKPEYTLTIKASPTPLKGGEKGNYALVIEPKGEYVFKDATPFKMKLSGSNGIRLDKSQFKKEDVKKSEDKSGRVETTFTAESGNQVIDTDVTFFLCTKEKCTRFMEKPSLPVPVG